MYDLAVGERLRNTHRSYKIETTPNITRNPKRKSIDELSLVF